MVAAVSMVKDEVDIVQATVGRMLEQTELVIVADNGSTDGTRELLEAMPVELVDDPEPGYYQSRKMSALASRAHAAGAEWIVPFDADECWSAGDVTIAELLRSLPPEAMICEAIVLDHVAVPEDVGRHWREYGRLSDDELREVFHDWFYSSYPDHDPNLVLDPCPLKSSSPGAAGVPIASAP
jgi:hypothetical protein